MGTCLPAEAMMNRSIVAAAAVALLIAAASWWWLRPDAPPQVPEAPVAAIEPTPPAAAAPASGPRHPIEAVARALGADASPTAADLAAAPTLEARLSALVGRTALLEFLIVDDFVRRLAVTVDNLGHVHAPARLWPVHPMPGRFEVVEEEGGPVVAAANARRYDAFVRFATGIDPARAVALYLRLYPQLQAAYEELGYPGRAFNDRMVEVIDLLLATPQIDGPPTLTLTEVKGPIPSTRPWVRYEWADPALDGLSAGQKMLLRVGPAHAAALKDWLTRARVLLAGGAAGVQSATAAR